MLSAALKGHVKAAFSAGKMLVSGRGTAANRQEGVRWITAAASNGHDEAIKLLSEIEKTVPSSGEQKPARQTAKAQPDLASPELRAARQSALSGADVGGRPALVEAAHRGQADAVSLALNAGADINAKDRQGATALVRAAAGGHTAVVELLLKSGADPTVPDAAGDTALILAKPARCR